MCFNKYSQTYGSLKMIYFPRCLVLFPTLCTGIIIIIISGSSIIIISIIIIIIIIWGYCKSREVFCYYL